MTAFLTLKSGLCEAHTNGICTSTFYARAGLAFDASLPYREIQNPRRRYVLIDYDRLAQLSGFDDFPRFQTAHREWVESALTEKGRCREAVWSESVAVGSRDYVAQVGAALGAMVRGRRIRKVAQGWELREPQAPYNADSEAQNGVIDRSNQRVWRLNDPISGV